LGILDKINSSNDIKRLKPEELAPLCAELREFIIEHVSRTGGHLASNLGAVELTVALHRVYDSERDRIVFDVGHQSYVHKILTGRKDRFDTLRQHGGLSGFTKPYEARDDAFVAGHASTSVSVALGMARARTIEKENYSVVAVIGDGALTGGLAYEGLANVGGSDEPIVIILNDNGMSINSNVGGVAKLLSQERVKPGYLNFKRWYKNTFGSMSAFYNTNHRIKEAVKRQILPANIFDAMGIYYLGPVDGHDVGQLETVIRWAKEMNVPVLVHAISKKGKGCEYAEAEPGKYHGVGRFDPITGDLGQEKKSFSTAFGNKLADMADSDGRIVAITAAMTSGTGLNEFEKRHPDRFFDVGIAEQHGAAMAAAMAKQGLKPVFAVYSSFLQRAYDMLIHDVSLQNLHVVFGVDRAGIVGQDGETHNGVFDIAYIGSVPGMQILCPASFAETETMLEQAINDMTGPVAVRYPRGGEKEYKSCVTEPTALLREGSDITAVAYGTMINAALEAAELLRQAGYSAEVIKLSQIKPLRADAIIESLRKTGRLLIAEDVCENGCVGELILSETAKRGLSLKCAVLCNLGDGIVEQGSVDELLREKGLDAQSLYEKAKRAIEGAM